MKIYGIYPIVIGTLGFSIVYFLLCYPLAGPAKAEWFGDAEKAIIAFYLFCAIGFFKLIIIKRNTLKIYSPLFFLSKKNVFNLDELKKVILTKNGMATGGFVTIEIYAAKNVGKISFFTQLYKFEIKRLAKRLANSGIEADVEGLSFYGE
jgi:hypothetical protein